MKTMQRSIKSRHGLWSLLRRLGRRAAEHASRNGARAALKSIENSRDAASSGNGCRTCGGIALCDLRPGDCGHVLGLVGSVRGRLRLLEMGLTPGTHVRLIRSAAFGGPLDILVRGYQLSLRRQEAAGVRLGPDEDG